MSTLIPTLPGTPRHGVLRLHLARALGLLALATLLGCTTASDQPPATAFELEPCQVDDVDALCGTYPVWENRRTRSGRQLGLSVVLLEALEPTDRPPILFLAGGPGQAASRLAGPLSQASLRQHNALLLIDQRGTGGDHRLGCDVWAEPGGPAADDPSGGLQKYLDPEFQVAPFERCRDRLAQTADLTLYDTPTAMDDLDEIRAALGFETIHLMGGSYGTRAALVFLRRHGEHVRGAVLNGVMPLAFTNPLFHAPAAQGAFDRLVAACAEQRPCGDAYDPAADLDQVLARLDAGPSSVTLSHPDDGQPVQVELSRHAFAEALRGMLYRDDGHRHVPALLHSAAAGDLAPFAQTALDSNRQLFGNLAYGMLLSVTCAEDVARIDPASIEPTTADTFYGDHRVRSQRDVCSIWPQSVIAEDYGAAVQSPVPTLLISGTFDPVTPPHWADRVAANLSNSRHVELPRTHFVRGPCSRQLTLEFLETADPAGLDTTCVETLPPLQYAIPTEGDVLEDS